MRPLLLLMLCLALSLPTAYSQTPERTPSAPARTEGDGPYPRLILRGGILISGEAALC
jgi:hypothetical protein